LKISLKLAFGLAVLAGTSGVVGMAAIDRYRARAVVAHSLTKDIAVTEQLRLDGLGSVQAQGFNTIIDLRPDGEAADQPAADDVRRAASRSGMFFAYVPVPHGDIPAATVDALARALSSTPKPVLLYCRTGRRAARTWALVEAQRPGGMDARAIERAVEGAGQSASDMDEKINAEVATRARSAADSR